MKLRLCPLAVMACVTCKFINPCIFWTLLTSSGSSNALCFGMCQQGEIHPSNRPALCPKQTKVLCFHDLQREMHLHRQSCLNCYLDRTVQLPVKRTRIANMHEISHGLKQLTLLWHVYKWRKDCSTLPISFFFSTRKFWAHLVSMKRTQGPCVAH